MRNLRLLDQYRDYSPMTVAYFGGVGDETCGAFLVPSPIDLRAMRIIASSSEGWDHLSVSRKNRTPNWAEMDHVKRLFFKDGEVAVQYHVAVNDHINVMPHCLHLWRCHDHPFPLPPKDMIA